MRASIWAKMPLSARYSVLSRSKIQSRTWRKSGACAGACRFSRAMQAFHGRNMARSGGAAQAPLTAVNHASLRAVKAPGADNARQRRRMTDNGPAQHAYAPLPQRRVLIRAMRSTFWKSAPAQSRRAPNWRPRPMPAPTCCIISPSMARPPPAPAVAANPGRARRHQPPAGRRRRRGCARRTGGEDRAPDAGPVASAKARTSSP